MMMMMRAGGKKYVPIEGDARWVVGVGFRTMYYVFYVKVGQKKAGH